MTQSSTAEGLPIFSVGNPLPPSTEINDFFCYQQEVKIKEPIPGARSQRPVPQPPGSRRPQSPPRTFPTARPIPDALENATDEMIALLTNAAVDKSCNAIIGLQVTVQFVSDSKAHLMMQGNFGTLED